jgi:MOSC domain-containing protein YiiM
MIMHPNLVSIQIGKTKTYQDGQGAWETAFFKEPITGPIFLGSLGLDEDAVANTKHHGGPEQAVLLYCAEHYPLWQAELGQGLPYGGFAENLTISGLDESTVCIGDTYQIGVVKLQVTKPRLPCWKIARRWGIPDLTRRVTQSGRMGWYCRVLSEGKIEAGLSVDLLERSNPEQTVARVFQEYLQSKEKSG